MAIATDDRVVRDVNTNPKPEDGLLRALGRLPSGLFVVTAGTGADATGFLASWVQQAGFEPPSVTVAMKKGRPIVDLVRSTAVFVVNVLGDSDKALLAHFARGFAPGEPAFTGVATAPSAVGVPHLTDAVAHLACRVRGEGDWSDHLIVFGEVVDGRRHRDDAPMVHVRKTGANY